MTYFEDTPLSVADEFPVVGRETTLTLPESTTSLVFTYQPEAPVAREIVVETEGRDEFAWTPDRAGIVRVEARKGEEALGNVDVSVKFDGMPLSGLFICLFAALLLFGGATHSMRTLLRGEDH